MLYLLLCTVATDSISSSCSGSTTGRHNKEGLEPQVKHCKARLKQGRSHSREPVQERDEGANIVARVPFVCLCVPVAIAPAATVLLGAPAVVPLPLFLLSSSALARGSTTQADRVAAETSRWCHCTGTPGPLLLAVILKTSIGVLAHKAIYNNHCAASDCSVFR